MQLFQNVIGVFGGLGLMGMGIFAICEGLTVILNSAR